MFDKGELKELREALASYRFMLAAALTGLGATDNKELRGKMGRLHEMNNKIDSLLKEEETP